MPRHDAGLAAAILAAWRDLGGSINARLAARPRDAELLVWGLVAALIGFVAGLPDALRQASSAADRDMATGLLATRLFGAVFVMPLFLFCLSGLSHALARLAGGKGSYWAARVALFWAVLVSLPLVLVNGFAAAWAPARVISVISVLTFVAFLWVWARFLAEVEGFSRPPLVFATFLAIPGGIGMIARML